jgi:hypothetical protein
VTLGDADKTGNGRDVDDGAAPAVCTLSSLLNERQEGSAEEEGCNDVSGVDVTPVLEADTNVSGRYNRGTLLKLTCPRRRGSSSSRRRSCHRE